MFPDVVTQTAIAILATLAVGGVAWVFIYPYLSGDAAASQRLDRVSAGRGARGVKGAVADLVVRKRSVENTLKDIEKRQASLATNPPLSVRLEQSGLGWTRNTFLTVFAMCGAGGLAL